MFSLRIFSGVLAATSSMSIPPARMNLGFDDYGQAEFFGRFFSFGDRPRHAPARHFDVEAAQQFLRLILMDLHNDLASCDDNGRRECTGQARKMQAGDVFLLL